MEKDEQMRYFNFILVEMWEGAKMMLKQQIEVTVMMTDMPKQVYDSMQLVFQLSDCKWNDIYTKNGVDENTRANSIISLKLKPIKKLCIKLCFVAHAQSIYICNMYICFCSINLYKHNHTDTNIRSYFREHISICSSQHNRCQLAKRNTQTPSISTQTHSIHQPVKLST